MQFQEICNVLYSVCENGNLFELESISDNLTHLHVKNEDNKAFRIACLHGHLEVLKWLVDKFGLTVMDVRCNENWAFRIACLHGHLEVAKWLVDKFRLTIEDVRSLDNYAFRLACSHGHLEVAKWLVDIFGLTIDDVRCLDHEAFRYACQYGHLNILHYLIGRFQLTEDDYSAGVNSNWTSLITKACVEGNKFMVSWFITKFPKKEIPEEFKEFVEEVIDEHEVMIKRASLCGRVEIED